MIRHRGDGIVHDSALSQVAALGSEAVKEGAVEAPPHGHRTLMRVVLTVTRRGIERTRTPPLIGILTWTFLVITRVEVDRVTIAMTQPPLCLVLSTST